MASVKPILGLGRLDMVRRGITDQLGSNHHCTDQIRPAGF